MVARGRRLLFSPSQSILSVMIRNFSLSLRDGPDTNYEMYRTVLIRPRIPDSKELAVPVYIRRIED